MSEHWQHVGLRVPEGVAVVAGTGQTLGGNRPPLGPCRRLQDVEEREAYGLLHLGVAGNLDIGAIPEGVEVGALLVEQTVPPHFAGRTKRSCDLVPQRR